MKPLRLIVCLLSLSAWSVLAQFEQPYQWSHSVQGGKLIIEVEIPETAYLYAEQTIVVLVPEPEADQTPVSHSHTDDFGTSDVYEGGQTHRWVYDLVPQTDYQISVAYQGCGGGVCYPPSKETFIVGASSVEEPVLEEEDTPSRIREGRPANFVALLDRFETVRSDGGMKTPEELLSFLDVDQKVKTSSSLLAGKSVLWMIVLVLLGGLALNLTPCVLPMIPVNLAIIGAGAEAATKRQGFVRGGVYGLGIALAYGSLGVFAVLTGSKFGTLNASPVFNFIIAGVFVILALAMFDVLNIDLSRYGSKFGISNDKRGRLIPAFTMGVVAALLAGACVAPIVIAVLLQATTLYAGGNTAGLFLPLLLGVGMALPWPIAGAGLTALPKPGMWMLKVKHGFGILIILFAAYYAYLGINLLPKDSAGGHSTEVAVAALEEQLNEALADGRPVFIDFWASWCKNCLQMEKTTFKDPDVIERLHDFKEIRFQAEKPGDPKIKEILDRYSLPGLPGYVILQKK